MAYNDLTFFTNEPERDLYSRFNTILSNNMRFFDILLGYFRTSGFFKLYPAMKGSQTNKHLSLSYLKNDRSELT